MSDDFEAKWGTPPAQPVWQYPEIRNAPLEPDHIPPVPAVSGDWLDLTLLGLLLLGLVYSLVALFREDHD